MSRRVQHFLYSVVVLFFTPVEVYQKFVKIGTGRRPISTKNKMIV